MKRYLLLCLLVTSVLAGFPQTILFDQTNNVTNSGTVAQDFETGLFTYDCMAADDFEVPTGETWYLDSIKLYGFYAAQNNDPYTEEAGIAIILFEDNNGALGNIVYSDTVDSNVDADADGAIAYHWTNPLELQEGVYWIAGAARKDFLNGGGQWYWFRVTTGYGNDFLWQNPGDGFTTGCTSWSGGGNCLNVTEDGMTFRVYGCYSPNKPQIDPLPEDTSFCAGPVLTLNASSPSQNVVFLWNTGQTGSSISVNDSGYYRVYAFDTLTECGRYSDIVVDVIHPPDPGLDDVVTCEGFHLLNAFVSGQETFLWHDGSTSQFYYVSSTEQTSVTVTDTVTGCTFVDSALVQIVDELDPQLNVSSPYGLCQGDTLSLSTMIGYATYNWSNGSTNPALLVTESGTYSVTVSNGNGCDGTTSVEVFAVTPPVVNIELDTLSSGDVLLSAPNGFAAYAWSTGDSTKNLIVSQSGLYEVTVFDEHGCAGSSSVFLLVVGVDEVLTRTDVSVYPNPARDRVTVSIPARLAGSSTVQLLDMTGKVVVSLPLTGPTNELNTAALAPGYYLVKVLTEQGEIAQPLILR